MNGDGTHNGSVNGGVDRSLMVRNNSFNSPIMLKIYSGDWEYEYRHSGRGEDNTPRSYAVGNADHLERKDDETANEDLTLLISTAAGYEKDFVISTLSSDLGRTRLNSSLSQDGGSVYGTQYVSRVDDSGITIPRHPNNAPRLTYSTSPTHAQSPFLSSRKTLHTLSMSDRVWLASSSNRTSEQHIPAVRHTKLVRAMGNILP